MHYIQKQILDQLRTTSSARYAELQPDGIESSHFKYHLNQLIKDNLVEQHSRGIYALTGAGKSAVDRLSKGKVNPNLSPKVITYTLLKDSEHYYLQRKDKEPYLGLVNMIGGKVHQGESTKAAAAREVAEKTGINTIEPTFHGTAEIRITEADKLLTHAIAYIYSAAIAYDSTAHPTLVPILIGSTSTINHAAPDLLAILGAVESSATPFALDLNITHQPTF